MKILYLAHRIPYPPNKGDKIRSFNEIKHLAKNHTVDLICLADNPDDLKHKKDLLKYCRKVFVHPISTAWSKMMGLMQFCFGKPISVAYFYRKAVQAALTQYLETDNYDAVICFSSSMAEYIFKAEQFINTGKGTGAGGTKLIMDFCDVDSDKWLQYAENAKFPLKHIYRAENKRLKSYERKVFRAFDSSILVSDQEKILFLKIDSQADDIIIVPNGVDTNYFSPGSPEPYERQNRHPVLVFTGAMDYHANVDGVSWFCRNILPVLQKKYTDLQFYIVGRNPSATVRKLEAVPGINVIDNAADIRPWYQKADIYVVPLRMARGVQNKVLEAMAMQRAIVSTSKANAGIRAMNHKELFIADTPEEFTEAVSCLIENNDKRIYLGENARQFVKENHDWSKNLNTFDNLLI